MRHLLVLASALLALAASGCNTTNTTAGQTGRFGPSRGESEATIAGALSKVDADGSETDLFIVQTSYGYYYTDEIEFGGQALILFTDSDGSEATAVGLSPYGRYNWRLNERSAVYAGAHLGLFYIDTDFGDDTSLAYGVHGGFKNWLSPTTAFFVEPRFTTTSDDVDQIDVLFGFAFTF